MAGIEDIILSEKEIKLAVPWIEEEGFWHEDYAQEKEEMLKAAKEEIIRQLNVIFSSSMSPHLRRKIPSLNKYLLRYPIRNISIRRAVVDIPLKLNEPGTQFMEVREDLLILRFPGMREILQFMDELSDRLGGMSLELRESSIRSIYYELYLKATLRL